jgi:hypothetical protein
MVARMSRYGDKDRIGAPEQPTTVRKMLLRLEGLLDTHALSDWEQGFVRDQLAWTHQGQTDNLTSKEREKLTEIHKKHFA